MLIVINQLSVKPEWVEKIRAAFAEHLDLLAKEPGFGGFRFLSPLNPAESPCVVEVYWADEACFEAWKQSDHFRLSHARMGQFREAFTAAPKFGKYTIAVSQTP